LGISFSIADTTRTRLLNVTYKGGQLADIIGDNIEIVAEGKLDGREPSRRRMCWPSALAAGRCGADAARLRGGEQLAVSRQMAFARPDLHCWRPEAGAVCHRWLARRRRSPCWWRSPFTTSRCTTSGSIRAARCRWTWCWRRSTAPARLAAVLGLDAPVCGGPDGPRQWTRTLAAQYVASVNNSTVGGCGRAASQPSPIHHQTEWIRSGDTAIPRRE
jgi:hypothetical protein